MVHLPVFVIIVNFNGANYLPDCLKSLKKQIFKNYGLVVVDNASQDKSRNLVTQFFPEAKLILNTQNFGFPAAANLGIRYSLEKRINSLGNEIHFLGFGFCSHYLEKDFPELRQTREIAYASGATMLVKKQVFEKIGFLMKKLCFSKIWISAGEPGFWGLKSCLRPYPGFIIIISLVAIPKSIIF